jgi:hypothetical protein
MWRGNRGITPTSSKITARQSGDHAGQNKIVMAQQSQWHQPKGMTHGNVPAVATSQQSAKVEMA